MTPRRLTHRVFAILKGWRSVSTNGLRDKHLQSHLEEIAFHFNRHILHAAFRTLLGIAAARTPAT